MCIDPGFKNLAVGKIIIQNWPNELNSPIFEKFGTGRIPLASSLSPYSLLPSTTGTGSQVAA